MDKILVVAYYTPPLGLSGVMRVTKLGKFLPEFGWQPVILTVRPILYYAYDPRLLDDLKRSTIFRTDSLDPNRLLYKFKSSRVLEAKGLTVQLANSLIHKLINFILFPDSKIGWLPFAWHAGKKAIRELKPKAIFATAPPWTALLIGSKLAHDHQLPFIADFRDPWPTGFQPPPLWQQPLLIGLRKRLLRGASLVLTVNSGTAKALGEGVEILENGFDPEEFALPAESLEDFSILYVGNLWENTSEIASFLAALTTAQKLLKEEFRFYLAGRVDPTSQALLQVNPAVRLLGMVPHSRATALMKGADVLLYLGKPGQPVGLKLYEYLGAQKPIVVWGSEGNEAAELVKGCDAGFVCGDSKGLAAALKEIRKDPERFGRADRRRFDRRFQAEFLARRLNELLNR